jgi:hypothetical protein
MMSGGFFGQGGLLQLTHRAAIVATVGIDSTETVDRQGVATVTGTLACNQGTGASACMWFFDSGSARRW